MKAILKEIIAIDGPSGSGKSTASRMLAGRMQCLYLDTGAMYRAVALVAKRKGIDPEERSRLGRLCRSLELRFDRTREPPRLILAGEDITDAIRTSRMDLLASRISAVKEVRDAMVGLQRRMAGEEPLVAEGRDMGTVVFPDAGVKFFLTAGVKTRARRRYLERKERGEEVALQRVEEEMQERDHQDATRALSPLRPADDAVIIDSSGMTPEEVVERMLGVVKEKFGKGRFSRNIS